MEGMKKKKSSGGRDKPRPPINRSRGNCNTADLIDTGVFPKEWKRAVVTPFLKKGSQKDKTNYRPVSCLAAASKVPEKSYANRF